MTANPPVAATLEAWAKQGIIKMHQTSTWQRDLTAAYIAEVRALNNLDTGCDACLREHHDQCVLVDCDCQSKVCRPFASGSETDLGAKHG